MTVDANASPNAPDLERTVFDVCIVGSGFGGGTVAYALSRAGLKVLLVERGGWPKRDDTDWDGRAILLDGRYHGEAPVRVQQRGPGSEVETFPNEVVGGNSIFFGGATLRLRATDFARWPVSYATLEPHYTAAEALLEVHGHAGDDPCEPPRSAAYPFEPAPLTAPALRILEAARAIGFRPFALPVAINHRGPRAAVCINCVTCDGFPCRIGAKNDVTQTALRHADRANLLVLARVVARRLVEREGRVVGLEALDRDGRRKLTLRAKLFVVAGGAIGSAALLLGSGLDRRDDSGTLGRNLMRHCNAMVGYLFPFRTNPERVNHKQICVTDLYESVRERDGTALGVIQDMCMPPREVVRALGPPGFRWAASLAAGSIQTLLCIAEDDARWDNRVTLVQPAADAGDEVPLVRVEHAYTDRDRGRRDTLVGAARKILRRAGGLAGKVRLIDSFSHAVGTARFAADRRQGALDVNCRFWGSPNLYVVDGSFMPSSGGVNPSLTITANALRVAAHLQRAVGELAA